jgi:hypothetical protein
LRGQEEVNTAPSDKTRKKGAGFEEKLNLEDEIYFTRFQAERAQ